MGEHDIILSDMLEQKAARPARHFTVPAVAIGLGVGDKLVWDLAKRARDADGAAAYVSVNGRTFRMTLEVLR